MLKLAFLFFVFGLLLCQPAQAGITLRLKAVNPSDSEKTVTIKSYLPLEVKPEDVIYKDDLEVIYDTQQGSYYVLGDYEIKPIEEETSLVGTEVSVTVAGKTYKAKIIQ